MLCPLQPTAPHALGEMPKSSPKWHQDLQHPACALCPHPLPAACLQQRAEPCTAAVTARAMHGWAGYWGGYPAGSQPCRG